MAFPSLGGGCSPRNEFLIRDCICLCGVVDEGCTFEGHHVAVDGDAVGASLYGDVAIGHDCAVERLVAKVAYIVGQEFRGVYQQVEGELGEVFVVDASTHIGNVVVTVVEGYTVEHNLVVDEGYGVAAQLVGRVEGGDSSLSVDDKAACEVYGAEGTGGRSNIEYKRFIDQLSGIYDIKEAFVNWGKEGEVSVLVITEE